MRGAEGLAERTVKDYRSRLVRHLLPFFGQYPPSKIDIRLVERFKRQKLREGTRSSGRVMRALRSERCSAKQFLRKRERAPD